MFLHKRGRPLFTSYHDLDLSVSLSVILQLGTLYQQPFKSYHHHHPVSAAISN